MSLTVHYINSNFKLKNYTLRIKPIQKSHTGENLCQLLRTGIEEWGLNETKIKIYFTTDNAANIVKAVKLCSEWERVPCFAHTLQVSVQKSRH